MKVTLTYDPINGRAVPDSELDFWWKTVLEQNDCKIIGCELMVLRARVGLLEGDCNELVVVFGGTEYPCTGSSGVPTGFYDNNPNANLATDYLGRIARARFI